MAQSKRYSQLLMACLSIIFSALLNPAFGGTILGTKHDFTGLNKRAGVQAMPTLAFSNYGTPCVHCHVPPETNGADASKFGSIPGWNRLKPAADKNGVYDLYDSRTLDNKVRVPSPISLLCLSCHDGTMAVDMIVFKPNGWISSDDTALHFRINGANDLMSCGKCHNGRIAHNIAIKHIGTDLTNDHPISMTYAGLTHVDPDFRPPDGPYGFNNGVKLYDGRVECASCHNIHNPDVQLLLRVGADRLCETCHIK
ncbi:MAG: cytochrome c3 family protein [Gammaproteobacteria bacterium]|nr:cytochrome c3 family protein [Gammaproteobacteria bacterium]